MKNFLKNTVKFILLCVSVLTTLWLIILLVLYFTLDVTKIKNFTLNFFQANTNIVLNVEDVSLKLFPNVELMYSKVLASDKLEKKVFFKTDSLLINFNYLELLSGDLIIKVKLGDSAYNTDHVKLNFTNIAYTYASFLFLSKYIVSVDSLNIETLAGSILKLRTELFIDPLNQNARADSSLKYWGVNYLLKTKFRLSPLGVDELNFSLESKELLKPEDFKIEGDIKRVEGSLTFKELNVISGLDQIKFSSKSLEIKDALNFVFKTEELINKKIFTFIPELNTYIENIESPFSLEGSIFITYTGFKFSANILFTNPILGYKFKSAKVSNLLVLFEKTELTSKVNVEMYGERGRLIKRF